MKEEKLLEEDLIFSKLDKLDDKDLYKEMLEIINQIPKDKWSKRLLYYAVSALNNLEEYEEAEQLLKEQKKLCLTKEDNAMWYYLWGYIYYGRDEIEKAKQIALQSLELDIELEASQELLFWCKQILGRENENNDTDFRILDLFFYDTYLFIKGTEELILKKIEQFSEINIDDLKPFEFQYKMVLNKEKDSSFMILACPNNIDTEFFLNFVIWFEESASLVAFHKQNSQLSFVSRLYNTKQKDTLSLHFENNLMALVEVPCWLDKVEVRIYLGEDITYHTIQTTIQYFQVTKEELEDVRKNGIHKVIYL